MSKELARKRIANLAADGCEQAEMTRPREALREAEAKTEIVSPSSGQVQGWNRHEKAEKFPVQVELGSARLANYEALLPPGGLQNPDQLQTEPEAVEFVKLFFRDHKPVATIRHGLWLLADAGIVRSRKLTSRRSIRTDLRNAGAHWVGQAVVQDEGLITSRKPDDIPSFNTKMVEGFRDNA